MWWLDGNLFRGISGDRGRFLFRTSVPVSSHDFIKGQLTEAQECANKTLLEGPSDPQTDTRQLRADIKSLENAVREEKAHRAAIQSKLEKQATEHAQRLADATEASQHEIEQLGIGHQRETEGLRQRLAETERDAGDRNTRHDQIALATTQLRKMLASAEQKVAHRDSELAELEAQFRASELRFANTLAEAKHQHAIESKHLQAIAALAESRASERKEKLAQVAAELELLKEDNAHHIRQAAVTFYEQSLAEDAKQQNERELSDKVDGLNSEISRLQIELARYESDRSTHESKDHLQSGETGVIADLQQQLQVAEDQLRQSEAVACRLQERADELRMVVDLLEEDASAAQAKHTSEIAALKQLLERQHDAALDEARRSKLDQLELQAQYDKLREAKDSQFATLQSRIDQLIVALESEREICKSAEKESRRLSIVRSERIAFLSRHRERLLAEVTQLRRAGQLRSESEARIGLLAESASRAA